MFVFCVVVVFDSLSFLLRLNLSICCATWSQTGGAIDTIDKYWNDTKNRMCNKYTWCRGDRSLALVLCKLSGQYFLNGIISWHVHATERLSPAAARRECARISRANNRLVTVAAAKQKQFNWSIYICMYIMGNYASIHLWPWFWNRNEKKKKKKTASRLALLHQAVALGTRCNRIFFLFLENYSLWFSTFLRFLREIN